MKIKDRLKSAGFWTGIIGALFLILGAFGVEIGDQTSSAVINAVSSLFVVTGIASSPVASEDADGIDDKDDGKKEE